MFSISEFSEMCHLSPQTLRFYHSEGLLVPHEVNEQTGYRSYSYEQVEQAMMIIVLRGTGMSVKFIRRALDDPGEATALLEQHRSEVRRQRLAQDEAISDAQAFFDSPPRARLVHVPAGTVVSQPAPGQSAVGDQYDWDMAAAAVAATAQDMVRTVESCGAVLSGTPWRTWPIETPEQKRQNLTADEDAIAALPGDLEVQTFEARDEVSIFIPGKCSSAKFSTALSRLMAYHLDDAYPDLTRMRQVMHEDGVETALAICRLDEAEDGIDPVS
jgi:DNA-binding transcriptional MerR regulator